MIKRILALVIMLTGLLILAGCGSDFSLLSSDCDHKWEAATCRDPKTCTKCGKTRGEALDHEWEDATCTAPKTCKNCGKTEGGKTDHDWVSSGGSDKYCTMCGLKASEAPESGSNSSIFSELSIGDTVVMGYYGGEKIEWIVLDYDPSANQALLISKYCLDAIPYHAGSSYGSWENSTLRRWLNNSFINQAFTQEERDTIVTTHLSNPDNPDFDIDGGNDTTDRVFLLSYEEAVYYFPTQGSRKAKPTDYCLSNGCYDPVKYAEENGTELDPEAVGYTWWWLRTPGIDADHACNVLAKGAASSYGGLQTSNQGTIRPAMWIRLG